MLYIFATFVKRVREREIRECTLASIGRYI